MKLSGKSRELTKRYAHITGTERYRLLKKIPRHGGSNTFDHSVRVARIAERLSVVFRISPESAVKTGLLHDFCLVNTHRDHEKRDEWYCFYHPKDAVENAAGYDLTEVEKQAILSHMWPLSKHMPKSREAWVLTISDKLAAGYEGICCFPDVTRVFLEDIRRELHARKK